MASAEQYAQWIVNNADKRGTPEFETVANAYKLSRGGDSVADRAKSAVSGVADYYKNVNMGALRGAARIGQTILSPIDALTDSVTGKGQPTLSSLVTGDAPLSSRQERAASIDEFFKQNADPNSVAFQGGDLGAQIAGTAGVGGVLAKGVTAAGKAIPALSSVAPKVATALETGGMRIGAPAATTAGKVGDVALRTGAGAVTGGAMAGLVNPEEAGTGAMIGGGLPLATKAAGAVGSGLKSAGEHILGAMTGTGAEAVKGAFQAGQTGSREFLENMRGSVSFDDVVAKAKDGLRNMRAERASHYRSGMVDIKADKSVLDMAPITKAVDDLRSAGSFKGKVINEKSAGTVKEISKKVNEWAKSPAAEFHTPEGLDALKQAIGDIRDSTQFGTNARRAADGVYNTIKRQIETQAPAYSKVMKDYSEASQTISEIEKALSLGDKTSKDTAIRKLQSLTRNNAQTNYGNRLALANTLEEKGGVSLGPAVSGQAMNSWLPRGMIGAVEKAGLVGAPFLAPKALALAPLTSPRLMGEALYGAGRLSGGASNALNSLGVLPSGARGILGAAMENPIYRAGMLNVSNP